MDKQRAMEIASSPLMANVRYEGNQVYIQQVNEQAGTARIYPLDQPENQQEVPLESLSEH